MHSGTVVCLETAEVAEEGYSLKLLLTNISSVRMKLEQASHNILSGGELTFRMFYIISNKLLDLLSGHNWLLNN